MTRDVTRLHNLIVDNWVIACSLLLTIMDLLTSYLEVFMNNTYFHLLAS